MKEATDFADSLTEISKAKTEFKQPNNNGQSQGEEEQTFFDPEAEKKEAEKKEAEKKAEQAPAEPAPSVAMTPEALKASVITELFLTESLNRMVFGGLERLKFYMSLKADREALLILEDIPEDVRTPEQKRLALKLKRIEAKHERIQEGLPLTADEKQVFEYAFTEHTKATGKPLSPHLILISAFAELIIQRTMDIYM